MSHVDGTNPEPDPLKLPEEGSLEMMAFDGPLAGEPPSGESPLAAGAAATAEAGAGATEAEEEPADRKKMKRGKKRKKDRKEKETAGVSPEASGPSWFAKLDQTSPYTVMLAVALAGLLIGVLLLVLELGSYGFQFSPRK